MSRLEKVVSGGQSGVDRAALDAAREAGLATGGWCPAGRWAEDGPIPASYPLRETPGPDPAQRTQWNVRDSDATLVLARGAPRGGSALTLDWARRLGRPHLLVDLEAQAPAACISAWLTRTAPRVLNVAGPRESEAPGVGRAARALLATCLGRRAGGDSPGGRARAHG